MVKIIYFALILGTLFMGYACDDAHTVRYTTKEFQAKLTQHKLAVVAYYAPWCYYSQMLLPEFERSALVINSILKMNVGMVLVDCYNKEQEALCSEYKIVGYPTVKIFKNGVLFKDYNGPRKSEDLVYFMIDIAHGLIN